MKTRASAYVTASSSVSPLGETESDVINSLLNNRRCITPLPNDLFKGQLPVHFAGQLPSLTSLDSRQVSESFLFIKQRLIENLFTDFPQKTPVDLVIFSSVSGPNFLVYGQHQASGAFELLNNTKTLNNSDFLNYLANKNPLYSRIRQIQLVNTCSSGAAALHVAKSYIRAGAARSVLVIAFELTNHIPSNFISFASLGVLNTFATSLENLELSFSPLRSGFVKADGLCYTLVESEDSLCLSGNSPIAELIGGAVTSDCYSLTDGVESGEVLVQTIQTAVSDSGADLSKVSYISAHGSGTKLNDSIELKSYSHLFQDPRHQIRISSLKSLMGHALSAASLLEIDALMKMFKLNFIAPNHGNTFEATPTHILIPNQTELNTRTHLAIKCGFGFGGYNSALIFKNLT